MLLTFICYGAESMDRRGFALQSDALVLSIVGTWTLPWVSIKEWKMKHQQILPSPPLLNLSVITRTWSWLTSVAFPKIGTTILLSHRSVDYIYFCMLGHAHVPWRQLGWICSLLPPCEYKGSSAGHPTWWNALCDWAILHKICNNNSDIPYKFPHWHISS